MKLEKIPDIKISEKMKFKTYQNNLILKTITINQKFNFRTKLSNISQVTK